MLVYVCKKERGGGRERERVCVCMCVCVCVRARACCVMLEYYGYAGLLTLKFVYNRGAEKIRAYMHPFRAV